MNTRVLFVWFFAASAAVLLGQSSGNVDGSTVAPEKPFRLFSGCDIAANVDGKYQPVIGAGNQTLLVVAGQKQREIRLNDAQDIRLTPRLKLANVSAQIAKVSALLSSDAARQAQFREMQSAMAMSDTADAARDRAQGEFMRADMSAAALSNTRGPQVDPTAPSLGPSFAERLVNEIHQKQYTSFQGARSLASQQQTVAADTLLRSATANPNNGEGVVITPEVTPSRAQVSIEPGVNDTPKSGGSASLAVPRHLIDTGNGVSDRFDLEFEVSAPQRLEKAYVVVVTDFRVNGRNGVQPFRRVTGQRIGAIDSNPHKVSLVQTGFPAGFQVTDYRVVLFVGGQEIATNLIDNQAALSEDEAYQYIVSNYLSSHAGKTQPPSAMLMWPRSKVAITDLTPLRQPVYVFVDAAGQITSVSVEPTPGKDAPEPIIRALRGFRFIPALENGKPVSGRAKLVVADFL